MAVPQKVVDLVMRYQQYEKTYRSGQYNETQVRRDFIDSLFKALGWDIDNEQGYPEAYRHVIHEDAIRIQGAPKRPDYSFRIGGVRKFFVEARLYNNLCKWQNPLTREFRRRTPCRFDVN